MEKEHGNVISEQQMKFNNYIRELKLIEKQDNTERELYPLVGGIIAESCIGLSKRYVFGGQKRANNGNGRVYYGISSFPDIAIVSCDLDLTTKISDPYLCRNMLYGCVEIKNYKQPLLSLMEIRKRLNNYNKLGQKSIKELGQLVGEILWYKKVLYTNGIKWILFELIEKEPEEIEQVIRKAINNDKWLHSKNILGFVEQYIKETIIIEDCLDAENGTVFMNNIKKIVWKNEEYCKER